MATGFGSADKQAELLKDKGNLYFKKDRLFAAIEAYTEAITLCPKVATYWTNRALCHKRRNDWDRVEADCRKALEIDKSSLKARYLLGLALSQRNDSSEAVKQLEKALELSRGEASDMVEVIWLEVAKAKYAEWEKAALPRQQKQKVLREFCENALKDEYEKAMDQLEGTENSEGDAMKESSSEFVEIDKTTFEIAKLRSSHVEQKQTLAEVFDKAAECDKPSEVPEYLCCKITMDLYRDPVITPSGVTYERAVLLDHLEKVGKFDPLTRQPLQPNQLISNLAVKEAVRAYLAAHSWAYNMN
ncbi:hypothetical protein GOP47_0026512 [Adiantum capillus-veneris]|nr:hypothetical protein GOP47_0026512 [Adiantum capillus-veneris]